MSTEAFENFYFDVARWIIAKMAQGDGPARETHEKSGPRAPQSARAPICTFSIKGIGAKMCKGDRNIPDGEVFSCPVKNSVNGTIQFNTPTLYSGHEI